MIAHAAGDQDDVAGPDLLRQGLPPEQADARGIDEYAVAGAFFHHLGIAGDDGDAGVAGGGGHGVAYAAQFVYGQSRFQYHGAGQVQRLRAADSQIVDGAADRQTADVAPREKARTHHEAVRGQGQPVAESRADRAVAQLV